MTASELLEADHGHDFALPNERVEQTNNTHRQSVADAAVEAVFGIAPNGQEIKMSTETVEQVDAAEQLEAARAELREKVRHAASLKEKMEAAQHELDEAKIAYVMYRGEVEKAWQKAGQPEGSFIHTYAWDTWQVTFKSGMEGYELDTFEIVKAVSL
jgi:hypothetical protein